MRERGFTLLELMTVITVAGVLLAISVPSMVNIVQNNRILAVSNDFISAIHAGRMESIKRRATVVLCASSNADASPPACAADFSKGWVVFVDRNANGQIDANVDPAVDDTVLVSRTMAGSNLKLNGIGGNYVAFAPSGFARTLAALGPRATSLMVCDDRGNVESSPGHSVARVIVMAGTGRPEVLRKSDDINAYGGC